MILKNILLSLIISSSFLTVFAQESVSPTVVKDSSSQISNPYAGVFIQKDHNFDISFNLTYQVRGKSLVKYSVALFQETADGKKQLVNEYPYEEIIKVKDGELLSRTVSYTAPLNLKGNFLLFIVLKNADNSIFSAAEIGKVNLTEVKPLSYIKSGSFLTILVSMLLIAGFSYLLYRNGFKKSPLVVLFFVIMTGTIFIPTNIAHAYSFEILQGVLPPSPPNPPCSFENFSSCIATYNGFDMGTVSFSLNKTSFFPGETVQIASSIQSHVSSDYYQDFSLQCGFYNVYNNYIGPCTNVYAGNPILEGYLTAITCYSENYCTSYVGGVGPINIINATAYRSAPLTPGSYKMVFDAWSGYPASHGVYTLPFTVTQPNPPVVHIYFSSLIHKVKFSLENIFDTIKPSRVL
ncbi:MAG: hypothetical protein WCT07_02030 [Candidatus Paceibacterota bacterium]|jgi:hypothetical protein